VAGVGDELVAGHSPTALESLTLIVSDLEVATRFYRDVLGLRVISEFPGDYAALQVADGTTLGLHVPHEGHSHHVESAGIEIGFTVDDLNAWYSRLIGEGVQFLRAPTDMPWGTREAQLTDPDGHVVTLKAPADVPAS